ncbi:hypothetical protein DMB68_14095 [Flavobacterium hydrophilum]|uniref:Uncharacterized protein n=2 Tax=Flavobacterium hydrophilum TaxID=2211445 RepID=A0A2V4BZX3_9FLAO|nr:hypothetical protein DMB68_14095 [Flavobacterium hydrophilum]
MDIDTWEYSKISAETENKYIDFELDKNELPIFEIKSQTKHTLITTRQILEIENNNLKSIDFESIDDVIFGDFKGTVNKPKLSIFRIIDIYGEQIDFQMETGKASIGLIKSVNTVINLKRESLHE